MNVDSKLARTRLEHAAQAKDRTRRRRWLLGIGALALLALVSFATLDYWLLLSWPLRCATSTLLALLAGLGAWGWRGVFRRPTSLKEVALDAETQRDETDCVVSTAAEYASGETQTTHAYEPELAVALQTVAAQRLGTVQMPYTRTLRGPLCGFGSVLAALITFIVVTPGAWTALQRISLPWLQAQYTQVEVQPRDIELPLGQSVEVTGLFRGRPPKAPQLLWKTLGAPGWNTASMDKHGAAALRRAQGMAFVHSIENVTVPVTYRVRGGDAVSAEFRVTPYVPPEVKDLRVNLSYPEYTKLKPLTQTSPDITSLRGSAVTVHLRANVELSRARLCFSDTNLAPVELGRGENELWTGALPLARTTDYRIELFDAKGRRSEENTLHHIVATADNPPQVEILEPGQDMRAEATNRIPVRISAVDDYGITELKLVYHKLNGKAHAVVCQPESVRNGEWLATAELDLGTLDLQRYDVVAYHAEANDNNTLDGPGFGRSPLYFIEITDQASSPTPPLPPLPGEQVNLLVVQKQIIADTVTLSPQAAVTNYLELALRQTNALQLARLYLQSMAGVPEAVTEMTSAVAAMEQAIAPLYQRNQATAVPLEEAALAHLYRVLALRPDVKVLAVDAPPLLPKEQKPQTAVVLREIKKPLLELPPAAPEIEKALEEAKELSRVQAELNELGQKLAMAQRQEQTAPQPRADGTKQAETNFPKAEGQGQGQGQGEGEGTGEAQGKGKGQAQGQGQGQGNGEKAPEKAGAEQQLAKSLSRTNRASLNPLSQTNKVALTNQVASARQLGSTSRVASTNQALQAAADLASSQPRDVAPKQAQPPTPRTPAQLARAQGAKGQGTKPGKGRGQGKGKVQASVQKGKGQGRGTKPGDGSGQPSSQQNGEAPQMTDHPPEAKTPEELAQKQEELSAEAKALGELLHRLAGQGTRVGHNVAQSANKAAEHMEGAALALKQGNAPGAGRRGTMSSEALDQIVTELQRVLGQRPELRDVASEEAPKEYEAFISEYFRKLSYEK
jgi:hypothetical protein